MKMTKTTKKAIIAGYPRVLSIGYCGLQHLLWYEEPRAYTSGIYGWNADIYEIEGVAISTGYRHFGDTVSYELIKKYETAAKNVLDGDLPYEEKRERLHALAVEFVRKAVKPIK